MPKEIEPIEASFDDVARAMTLVAEPPPKPLKATHRGILPIGGLQLECYVLEDGSRVFAKRGMARALGLKSEGGNAFLKTLFYFFLRPYTLGFVKDNDSLHRCTLL